MSSSNSPVAASFAHKAIVIRNDDPIRPISAEVLFSPYGTIFGVVATVWDLTARGGNRVLMELSLRPGEPGQIDPNHAIVAVAGQPIRVTRADGTPLSVIFHPNGLAFVDPDSCHIVAGLDLSHPQPPTGPWASAWAGKTASPVATWSAAEEFLAEHGFTLAIGHPMPAPAATLLAR